MQKLLDRLNSGNGVTGEDLGKSWALSTWEEKKLLAKAVRKAYGTDYITGVLESYVKTIEKLEKDLALKAEYNKNSQKYTWLKEIHGCGDFIALCDLMKTDRLGAEKVINELIADGMVSIDRQEFVAKILLTPAAVAMISDATK